MDSLPPPAPMAVGGVDPVAASIPPSLLSPPPPASSSSSLNLSPSLLIIAALLAFVFCASVSIHLLLRCLSRASSSHPAPSPFQRTRRASEADVEAGAESARRSTAAAPSAGREQVEVDDEKERLIALLPLFTMASSPSTVGSSACKCQL